MNALLRKEFRLLLPALVATLVMTVAPVCFTHATFFARNGWSVGIASLFCFILGILFLALSPFGQEISLGTFGLLLVQPRARQRVWWVKVGALATAVALSLTVLCVAWHFRREGTVIIRGMPFSDELSGRGSLVGSGALAALVMVSGGLWTSLVFRQVTAAFWISLLVPGLILVAVRTWTADDAMALQRGMISMGAYSLVGFMLAGKLFLKAQDVPGGNRETASGGERKVSIRLPALAFKKRHAPWKAFLLKELQLHQVTLMMTGILGLIYFAVILASAMIGTGYFRLRWTGLFDGFGEACWLPWLLVPLMIGSNAVAEERRLKTLQGQLCLAARQRTVFAGKFLVALFLGTVLGAELPWLLVGLGNWMGVKTIPPDLSTLQVFVILSAAVGAIAFYASTVSQNPIQALGVALVLNVVAFYALSIALAFHPSTRGYFEMSEFPVGRQSTRFDFMDGCDRIGLFLRMDLHLNVLAWPVALAGYLWLSYDNFRQVQVDQRVWLRNLLILLTMAGGTLFAANVVHARPWERWMSLEPIHGPARIFETTSRHAKVDGAFVLLPDGRLWVRDVKWPYDPDFPSKRGKFTENTNWADVAPYSDGAVGLQSDHRLWRIDLTGKITQIGVDHNWNAICSDGFVCYLALKQDGTLWRSQNPISYRTNFPSPDGTIQQGFMRRANPDMNPVQVSVYGSNWLDLRKVGDVFVGTYDDGSTWQIETQTQLDRLGGMPVNAIVMNLLRSMDTNWISQTENRAALKFAVAGDGGLWARGTFPTRLMGGDLPAGFQPQGDQGGGFSLWMTLAFIEKNGRLWLQSRNATGKGGHASEYSDWLALASSGADVIALAADGTVSMWAPQYHSLLGLPEPRNRPIASVNIFDSK